MEIDLKILVEKYGHIISSVSHRMIKNNELAKEAAQEVWYEIIKSLNTFKGNSEISTWIYTITKRTILRYAANERIYKDYEINNYAGMGEIDYTESEKDKKEWVKQKCDSCLTAFCHCLTNEARLILLFKEIADLPYAQISIIMEMKEDNVRQIASRSLHKVRNFMLDNCPLYNPNGACRCRIKKHVLSIDFDKAYLKLEKTVNLLHFYLKFDKELPRKNYWEKLISEDVTK
jgi:RNA polymerase sigma factor (sigma-70 family)